MNMNTQEYEAKIRCLEYENQLLEKSREKGWMLVGELEIKNELLELKISRMGGDISNATPKYYAQMSITKCV